MHISPFVTSSWWSRLRSLDYLLGLGKDVDKTTALWWHSGLFCFVLNPIWTQRNWISERVVYGVSAWSIFLCVPPPSVFVFDLVPNPSPQTPSTLSPLYGILWSIWSATHVHADRKCSLYVSFCVYLPLFLHIGPNVPLLLISQYPPFFFLHDFFFFLHTWILGLSLCLSHPSWYLLLQLVLVYFSLVILPPVKMVKTCRDAMEEWAMRWFRTMQCYVVRGHPVSPSLPK